MGEDTSDVYVASGEYCGGVLGEDRSDVYIASLECCWGMLGEERSDVYIASGDGGRQGKPIAVPHGGPMCSLAQRCV